MLSNKVYLSIGRHEHYGYGDTAILRSDMLTAFQTGKMLQECLPSCETVYFSPLERAAETARFQALGMGCSHLLESKFLSEDTPKFEVQKFINGLLQLTTDSVRYYHFVTHLPVAEKLGLPFLGAGDVCLLTADSWQDMLNENYAVQTIRAPQPDIKLWQKIKQSPDSLEQLSADEIYEILKK
jgi:phosphohistidine phosphatase SixA